MADSLGKKLEDILGHEIVTMSAKVQLLDTFIATYGPVAGWKKDVSNLFDKLYTELSKEA